MMRFLAPVLIVAVVYACCSRVLRGRWYERVVGGAGQGLSMESNSRYERESERLRKYWWAGDIPRGDVREAERRRW
jgi:hypothetical protein